MTSMISGDGWEAVYTSRDGQGDRVERTREVVIWLHSDQTVGLVLDHHEGRIVSAPSLPDFDHYRRSNRIVQLLPAPPRPASPGQAHPATTDGDVCFVGLRADGSIAHLDADGIDVTTSRVSS
jgi:hypothetical protein